MLAAPITESDGTGIIARVAKMGHDHFGSSGPGSGTEWVKLDTDTVSCCWTIFES